MFRAEGVADLARRFLVATGRPEATLGHADEPVELFGQEGGLPGDPGGRHPPADRSDVPLFVDVHQFLDPPLVSDGVVVHERDDVARRHLGTVVPALQEADVLVVTVADDVVPVAEILAKSVEDGLVPVRDEDQFDVVVRLIENTRAASEKSGYRSSVCVQRTTETRISLR